MWFVIVQIIIEKAHNEKHLADMDKTKFLVPQELTMSQLVNIIRCVCMHVILEPCSPDCHILLGDFQYCYFVHILLQWLYNGFPESVLHKFLNIKFLCVQKFPCILQ